ncbi:MAG: hypothetical protein ABL903_20270 [Methylococcales bacterium]
MRRRLIFNKNLSASAYSQQQADWLNGCEYCPFKSDKPDLFVELVCFSVKTGEITNFTTICFKCYSERMGG